MRLCLNKTKRCYFCLIRSTITTSARTKLASANTMNRSLPKAATIKKAAAKKTDIALAVLIAVALGCAANFWALNPMTLIPPSNLPPRNKQAITKNTMAMVNNIITFVLII